MAVVFVLFRGVMLYVPSRKQRRVTALMPKTNRHHFGRFVEKHIPWLMVPRVLSEKPLEITWDAHELRREVHIPFKGARSKADTKLPENLADITPFNGGTTITQSVLRPAAGSKKVSCRVRLLQGKSFPSAAGLDFAFGDARLTLADHMVWGYETEKPVVVPTKDGDKIVPPFPGTSVILYGIYHMACSHDPTVSHAPPPGGFCREARHFYSLYSFFPNPDVEIPRHHSRPAAASATKTGDADHHDADGESHGEFRVTVDTTRLGPGNILDKFPESDPVTCVGGKVGG